MITTDRHRLGYMMRLKKTIPSSLMKIMSEWGYIHKSPYGDSFYNEPKDWHVTEPDTLRLSDHWNFVTKVDKTVHCRTNSPIENDTHWTLAKYNAETQEYEVITSLPLCSKKDKANKLAISLLILAVEKRIALETLTEKFGEDQERIEKLQKAFENKETNLKNTYGNKI